MSPHSQCVTCHLSTPSTPIKCSRSLSVWYGMVWIHPNVHRNLLVCKRCVLDLYMFPSLCFLLPLCSVLRPPSPSLVRQLCIASDLTGPDRTRNRMRIHRTCYCICASNAEARNQQRQPAYHVWSWKCMDMQYKKEAVCRARSAKWYARVAKRRAEKLTQTKHRKGIRRAVVICVVGRVGPSCVADDDARALLAEYTPLFGLGTPVPALLSTEEAEHARGFLGLRSLHERRALVSHLGP